jgi:hypothetical protein
VGLAFALACSCARREATPNATVEGSVMDSGASRADSTADPAPTFADPVKRTPQELDMSDDPLPLPVGVGAVEGAGGEVNRIEPVIAAMRPGFRACYKRDLAMDAGHRGKLLISVELGPSGEVTRATAGRIGQVDDDTTECVLRRVRSATFPPSKGAKIMFPVIIGR